MSNLYKESIADAKALKELALQNGRQMLSEAFSDKLEEAVNKMLNEESYVDDGKDGTPASALDKDPKGKDSKDGKEGGMKKESKDGDEDDKFMGMKGGKKDKKDKDGDKKPFDESIDMDDIDTFLESVDKELSEMREGKDKDGFADMGGDEKMSPEEKKKKIERDSARRGREKNQTESVDTSDIGKGDNKMPSPKSDRSVTEDPQGTRFFESLTKEDLMSIVMEALDEASKTESYGDKDDKYPAKDTDEKDPKKDMDDKGMKEMEDKISSLEAQLSETHKQLSETQEQLEEAENVIDRLSNTISEANLINSKLLYVNKLNNEFDLTENQKEKILTKINEGENIKEVKLIYSVLQESFDGASIKKKAVNESSMGTASGAMASTAPSKSAINESEYVNKSRFQVLAGIKAPNILED